MSKKLGAKQSALQRLSHNMNSMLANTGTKRRKLCPNIKHASCKKLKLKPDPTNLFKRFKCDIDGKENSVDPSNSVTSTLKSDNQKPKSVLKTWTPPLKVNSNSDKIFDKLQNTERSIGISNKAKLEINKCKIPSKTVTRASRENVDVNDENLGGTSELLNDIKEINNISKKKDHQDSTTKISQNQTDKLNVFSKCDPITNEGRFNYETEVQELNPMADTSIKLLHETAYNFNTSEDNHESKNQQFAESNNSNEAINEYKSEILLSSHDSDKNIEYETNEDYHTTNKSLNEIFIIKVSPNKNNETFIKSKDNENLFLIKETQLKSKNIIRQDTINEIDEVQVQNNDCKSLMNLNKNYSGLEFMPESNKLEKKVFYTFNDIISPQNLQSNSQMVLINNNETEKENNFIPGKDIYDAIYNNESQNIISLDNKNKIQKNDDEELFFTCIENNINFNSNLETDHEKTSLEKNNLNSQNEKTCKIYKLTENELNVCDEENKLFEMTTEINSMIDEKKTDLLKNNEIKKLPENFAMKLNSECILHDEIYTSELLQENFDKNFSKGTKIIDIINYTQESDKNEKYNQLTNYTISRNPECNAVNKSQEIINEDQIIETREEGSFYVNETMPSDVNKFQNNNDLSHNEIQSEEGQILSSESDNNEDSQETNLQITDDSREANINELINNKVDKLIIDENIEYCGNDLSNDKISEISSDRNKIIEEVSIYNKYERKHSIKKNNLNNHGVRNNHYNDSQLEECQIISVDSDGSKNSQESCFEVIKENENEHKLEELTKIEGIKKEKYDDLIECSDDFFDIQMSEVIRIENEYTETKMNFLKQTTENTYQTYNRSNISSTSKADIEGNSKNSITVDKGITTDDTNETVIPPLKLGWVQKMNEEKQKLRSITQEISKLNNIVLQARKKLWPHQFNNQ